MANIRIGRIVDDIWQNILDRVNGTEGKVQAEDIIAHGKLDALNAKDFATGAKQDSIKAVLDALNAKDISSSAKQEAIRLLIDALAQKDYATNAELQAVKAELATIKANQISGNQKVQLNGNLEALTSANTAAIYNATMRNPVTGLKTVTATAAEVFAGASRLNNRRRMLIRNEDQVLRCRVGSASVTQQNGFPLEPGATIEIEFEPSVYVQIYAVSEGANLQLAVIEL